MYDPADLYQMPMMQNMSVGFKKPKVTPAKSTLKPAKVVMPPHPTDTKMGMRHPNAHK